MTQDIERIAALSVYLAAVQQELAICPHCETWLLSDCINGFGCPTRDGRNGEVLRAHLASQEGETTPPTNLTGE